MKTIFELIKKEEEKELDFKERISMKGEWMDIKVNVHPKDYANSILISEDEKYVYCLAWDGNGLINTNIFRAEKK